MALPRVDQRYASPGTGLRRLSTSSNVSSEAVLPSVRVKSETPSSGSQDLRFFESGERRGSHDGDFADDGAPNLFEGGDGADEGDGEVDPFSRSDGFSDYYDRPDAPLAASQSVPLVGMRQSPVGVQEVGSLFAPGDSPESRATVKLGAVMQKKRLASIGSLHSVVRQAKGVRAAEDMMARAQDEVVLKRTKARQQVMGQRDEHEKWVEMLASDCDQSMAEREKIAAEIVFLEHNSHSRLLFQTLARLARVKSHCAWQTWVAATSRRQENVRELERLKRELVEHDAALRRHEADNEQRLRLMAESALQHASKEQYELLLKIFGRLTGQKSREFFFCWAKKVREFKRQFVLVSKILGKCVRQLANKAWVKWYYETFVAATLTLDEKIKGLKLELERAQKEAEKQEGVLERLNLKMMQDVLARSTGAQRSLVDKILTKMCQMYLRGGFAHWLSKVALYRTAKQKMGMIISRLCHSELNWGLRKWIMVCVKDKDAIRRDAELKLRRQTDALRDKKEKVDVRLRALMAKVEQMRESVQLQSMAAQGAVESLPEVGGALAAIGELDVAAAQDPSCLLRGPLAQQLAEFQQTQAEAPETNDEPCGLLFSESFAAGKLPSSTSEASRASPYGATSGATAGSSVFARSGAASPGSHAGSYAAASLSRCSSPPGSAAPQRTQQLNFSDSFSFSSQEQLRRDSFSAFGAPLSPEERAKLLVFVRSIEVTSADARLASIAPHLERHKKVIKRMALMGDPRLAASIKAYEATCDPNDLLESIDMIAASFDFAPAQPMY